MSALSIQITGYGYHHKHGYSAKKASDKGQKRAFRPLRRKSNSPFQEFKSDAQTNLRMLHGILVFYVVVANFTASKNEFKFLVCPKYAQNRVFHPKIRAEKASWKSPRSLIFQWQRGWDSNPRWLITTLDFEFSIPRFCYCQEFPRSLGIAGFIGIFFNGYSL